MRYTREYFTDHSKSAVGLCRRAAGALHPPLSPLSPPALLPSGASGTCRGVRQTRPISANHAPSTLSVERQWEELWASGDYENDYYYVSQLFEPNWQPRYMD